MRALDRIRSLAAVMTLLLFLATSALANVPRKPIDRPEGPPEPNPTEVGDPDMGGNLTRDHAWFLVLVSNASNPFFRRFILPLRLRMSTGQFSPAAVTRGR